MNIINKIKDLESHFEYVMKNPKFQKAWEEEEVEYKIAHQIIRARLEKGMTQKQLAEKMHTRQSVISKLESGKSNPSISTLKRVAEALNTSLNLQVSFR